MTLIKSVAFDTLKQKDAYILHSIKSWDYNGTTFNNTTAIIKAEAVENFTNLAQGTRLSFFTTSQGTTSPIQTMILSDAGDLAIAQGNAPTQALNAYRGGSTQTVFSAGNSNTGLNGTYFGVDATGNGIMNTTGAFASIFSTNSTERARFTSGGNFLIGTTTDAGQKLQVNGSAIISSNFTVDTNTLYVDASSNKIGFGTTSLTNFGRLVISAATSGSKIGVSIDTNGFNGSNANPTEISMIQSFTTVGTCEAGMYAVNTFADNPRQYLSFKTSNTSGTAVTSLTITDATATFVGSIKTAAPTTGTAAEWKLGSRVAAAVVLDATQYIEVEVGGTFYKLAIVT